MEKGLVSVIIPVYNSELYLSECINSVVKQTYKRLEIILINDGSIDKSFEIMKEFKKLDSRIKIINLTNSGVSYARNIGFKESSGEFIYFMDADDILSENAICKSINYLNKWSSDVCVFNYAYLKEENVIKNNSSIEKSEIISQKEYIKWMLLDNSFKGYVWNRLYRRNVIEKLNRNDIFKEDIYIQEDSLFNCEIAIASNKICYLNEILYLYRKNDNSNSNSSLNKENYSKKISVLKAMKTKIELLEDYDKNISAGLRLDYIIIANNIICIMKENRLPYKKIKKTINNMFNFGVLVNSNDYKKKLKVLLIIYTPFLYNFFRVKVKKLYMIKS